MSVRPSVRPSVSSIFCTQQVTNKQHSGKPQLREVTAPLGPFTAAAAQKRERCAQLMEAQLMEAQLQLIQNGSSSSSSARAPVTENPGPGP
jgi:hypothetical protein